MAAEGSKNEADISKELAVKHPLQNKWAWWFYKNDKSKTWEANLRLITTFDTVSSLCLFIQKNSYGSSQL